MDERYATFREHAESRERIATLEVTVSNLPTQLARIETAIIAKSAAPADHINWQSTAHRAMDLLEQRKQSGGVGVGTMILIGLGMMLVGFAGVWFGKVFL